ncbi:unnamed protein product [Absidia cylindrospora]
MKAWSYLSSGFTNIPIPSNIQKRLYKFLLRKAIGQFLATDLHVDNFDIELLNGSVELRDLELNLDAINDLLIDTSFILVKGRAASISASLPWFNWSGETTLKVQGLNLTLKPTSEKQTRHASENDDEASPVLSSSLHFADDFLKTEMEPDQDQELYEFIQQLQDPEQTEMDYGVGGLQVLTRVIDKMLAKVKVDIIDTVIHVIHPSAVTLAGDFHRPGGGNKEYSLDIEIPKISYFDETPGFSDNSIPNPISVPAANMVESSILLPSSGDEIIKIITITSPKIWIRSCDIPSIYSQSTKSETTLDTNDAADDTTTDLSQTEFYDASQGDSNLFQRGSLHSSFMSGSVTPKAFPSSSTTHNNSYEALLFTTMDKDNWLRLKVRTPSSSDNQTAPIPSSESSPPTKNIDIYFSHIRTIITPKQVAFLLDIFTATNNPSATDFAPATPTLASAATSSRNKRASNLGEVIREQRRPSYTGVSPPSTNMNGPASHRDQDKRANHGSSSFKMAPEQPPSSTPGIKIKLQVPLMELFFLYNEMPPTSSSSAIWSSTTEPPTRDTSHLKLWIHQLIIRLQQYPISNTKKPVDRRRPEGLRRSPLPRIDTTTATNSRHQTVLSSVFDMRIQTMGLAEWVTPILNHTPATVDPAASSLPETSSPSSSVKMKYNCYLPILEFDDSIGREYDDTQDFPAYIHQSSTRHHGGKTGLTGHGSSKTKKDVIRIRLEKRSSVKLDQFNEMTSFDQDLTADIQAMNLLLDPNIADRLENYAYVFIDFAKSSPTKHDVNENISASEPSFDQKIYEDLDKGTKEHQQCIQAKVRLAFLRLILYAPDMSQSNTRDEFNDKFHDDILSVDIKKIAACWNTDLLKHQPQRATVDLDSINVFLKQAHDPLTRCWFKAKGKRNGDLLSSVSQTPSMEITLRSSTPDTPHAPSSARPGYFGTGSDIPSNLFEYLSRNEFYHSEEKMHVPVEDQAESAMVFKQRTVETSTFVINCHFPTTYMTLSKQTWDKVQILQNDLLLWQPRIIAQLEQEQDRTDTSTIGSLNSEPFRTPPHRRYSDLESSRTSILSQSHERLNQPHDTQTSSLFSIIAVMSEGVWDLHTNSTDKNTQSTYRFQFSDFRYFAVIKHLGMNENITTLDIEDLTLDDIGHGIQPIPLFYRTLPKSILPKRNTSLVSIFSRLTTIPELNKQNKTTSVVACNLCWKFTPDISFLENLIGFQKTPDDLVFIDPPTQHIKVYAHVLDTSVDYKPLSIPSRAVVVLDNIQVVTDILAGQPLVDIKTFIQCVDVFLVDDINELDGKRVQETSRSLDARNYWSMYGMASALTSRNLETQVKIKLDEMLAAPGVEVAILNDILTLEGCADSFQSLNNFITYATNDGDRTKGHSTEQPSNTTTKKSSKRTHTTLVKTKEDMLASLDEEAFRHRQRQQQQQNQSSSSAAASTSQYSPMPTDLKMVEGYYSGTSASKSKSTAPNPALRPRKPRRKRYQQQKPPEDIIRVLLDEIQELDIVENYYGIDKKKVARKPVVDIRRSIVSLRVKDVDIIWKLYSGYDWSYVRSAMDSPAHPNSASSSSTSTSNTAKRRSSSRPSSSSSNHRFPTTYSNPMGFDGFSRNSGTPDLQSLGNQLPSLNDRSPSLPGQLPTYSADSGPSGSSFDDYRYSRPSSTDSRRSSISKHSSSAHRRHHRHGRTTGQADMELRIEGICFELDIMVPEEQTYVHSHLEIRDIEIADNIKTSTWDTFFGSMRSDSPSSLPRESDSCMLIVDLIGTRPVIQDTTVEYRLRIKTLPMRLYIDQDALNFLVKFFTFNPTILRSSAGAKSSTSYSDPMPIHDLNIHQHTTPHHRYSSPYGEDNATDMAFEGASHQPQDSKDDDIFFQSVEIHPIDLKIDYKPKYINYDNIKEGQYAELVNLFQLEGAKLNLSAVKLNGINGVHKLLDRLSQEWLPHIKNTQLLHIFSGVSPIRSMVNLGSGVADLILLPIQQYRKDGRVIKGLQRGTQSFARSTAMEVVKLSARLASGTQVILEHADGFLSSGATTAARQHQQAQHHHQQHQHQRHNYRHTSHGGSMDSRDDTISSSSSISTVIGSRTSEDMVFIFTDKNLDRDED